MLSLIIFTVCFGLSSQQTLPHGHELQQMVDTGFRWLDKNSDGILTYDEMAAVADKEDANSDGIISFAEYVAYANVTEAAARPMFDAYDKNGDGLIPADFMKEYMHVMDLNGDGIVNMHEFDHYYTQVIQCVYGQHGHGHATHGHAATCV